MNIREEKSLEKKSKNIKLYMFMSQMGERLGKTATKDIRSQIMPTIPFIDLMDGMWDWGRFWHKDGS